MRENEPLEPTGYEDADEDLLRQIIEEGVSAEVLQKAPAWEAFTKLILDEYANHIRILRNPATTAENLRYSQGFLAAVDLVTNHPEAAIERARGARVELERRRRP